MTQEQKIRWEKIRVKGKKKYLLGRILPIGILYGILFPFFIIFFEKGIDFNYLKKKEFFLMLLISLILSSILWYFIGKMSWNEGEKRYLDDKPCYDFWYTIGLINKYIKSKFRIS